ncbi:hypothetical protein T03_16661 [Trichinella britovi]|uniref:Uncharacterized protein n=2 Tax=Trichinella TaxID=6333 RepID=A0A0V1CHB4_TRIBR|nr:hypothetical protein T05_13372 [Trichinella murrelli]KRY48635.1 hypothetical protein T03_16661 [Trichinella britovi]
MCFYCGSLRYQLYEIVIKERLNYTNVFDSGSSSRFSQRTPPSGSHRNFIGGPADKFHWLRCPE